LVFLWPSPSFPWLTSSLLPFPSHPRHLPYPPHLPQLQQPLYQLSRRTPSPSQATPSDFPLVRPSSLLNHQRPKSQSPSSTSTTDRSPNPSKPSNLSKPLSSTPGSLPPSPTLRLLLTPIASHEPTRTDPTEKNAKGKPSHDRPLPEPEAVPPSTTPLDDPPTEEGTDSTPNSPPTPPADEALAQTTTIPPNARPDPETNTETPSTTPAGNVKLSPSNPPLPLSNAPPPPPSPLALPPLHSPPPVPETSPPSQPALEQTPLSKPNNNNLSNPKTCPVVIPTDSELPFRLNRWPSEEASAQIDNYPLFPVPSSRLPPSNPSTPATSRTNGQTTRKLLSPTTCSPTAWDREVSPLARARSSLSTESLTVRRSTGELFFLSDTSVGQAALRFSNAAADVLHPLSLLCSCSIVADEYLNVIGVGDHPVKKEAEKLASLSATLQLAKRGVVSRPFVFLLERSLPSERYLIALLVDYGPSRLRTPVAVEEVAAKAEEGSE
jgi:hypothetical protein